MGLIFLVLDGNTPAKKTSQRAFKRGKFTKILPSERHENWHDANMASLVLPNVPLPLSGRQRMSVHFVRKAHRKWDYTNALDAVQDFLVDAGILSDDNAEALCLGNITHEYDKTNPRAIVFLEDDSGTKNLWRKIVDAYSEMRKILMEKVNRG